MTLCQPNKACRAFFRQLRSGAWFWDNKHIKPGSNSKYKTLVYFEKPKSFHEDVEYGEAHLPTFSQVDKACGGRVKFPLKELDEGPLHSSW